MLSEQEFAAALERAHAAHRAGRFEDWYAAMHLITLRGSPEQVERAAACVTSREPEVTAGRSAGRAQR